MKSTGDASARRPKLEEARFFLSKMIAEAEDQGAFCCYLSAFLSAARSVLQYACAEVGKGTPGRMWYDREIGQYSTLGFFKDKRDLNVHERPVKPDRTRVEMAEQIIRPSDALFVKVFDRDGNLVSQQSIIDPPRPPKPERAASAAISWYFDDWPGNEDIVDLCKRYLTEVEALLRAGEQQGYFSA
jgi:hypothetical protein